jgi:hypothetical protein
MIRNILASAAIVARLAVLSVAGVVIYGSVSHAGPNSIPSAGPLKPGMARIVVIRQEKVFTNMLRDFPVKVDNEAVGGVKTGGFVYVDRPAGRHVVSIDLWDIPGVSRYEIKAAAGRTYFIEIKLKDKVAQINAAGAVLGLAGAAVAMAATNNDPGPVNFKLLSEVEGARIVSGLR